MILNVHYLEYLSCGKEAYIYFLKVYYQRDSIVQLVWMVDFVRTERV